MSLPIRRLPELPAEFSRFPPAVYRPIVVPGYQGNPLIEALPELMDAQTVSRKLARYPRYDPTHRRLPDHVRLHVIWDTLKGLFVCDDRHEALEATLSMMIRSGYKGRNPVDPAYWGALRQSVDLFDGRVPDLSRSCADALGLIGISGGGKSCTLHGLLSLYQQVIRHTAYQGQPLLLDQLTWLKLECPHQGNTKALCLNFLREVGRLVGQPYANLYGSGHRTQYDLMSAMARVAAVHSLGLLVVDEIQVLSEAKSGGAEAMLNFFVELINTIGVPIVLVGTYQAAPLFMGKFRQARRVSGRGDCIWRAMAEGDEWDFFVEALWTYDYLRTPTVLTPALSHVLFEETQGIADLAVKVFALAQWRAITSQTEQLSEAIIRSVALDSLQLLRPLLQALRTGHSKDLERIGDISPLAMDGLLHTALTQLPGSRALAVTAAPAAPSSGDASGRVVSPDPLWGDERTGGDRGPGSAPERASSPAPASAVPGPQDASRPPRPKKTRRPRGAKSWPASGPSPAPGSIMDVAAQGERQGLAAEEALRQAGLMRPVAEYFGVGGPR